MEGPATLPALFPHPTLGMTLRLSCFAAAAVCLAVLPLRLAAQAACQEPPCPVTVGDHFHSFTSSVFGWDTPVTPWIEIAPLQHFTSHSGFRDGEKGYLNQYKVAMWDTFDFKFQRHFLYPTLFHQDENYVPLGAQASFGQRVGHALDHMLVTRSADHTHDVFNASGLPAAATTALISNLYYPATLRTRREFALNFGLNIGLRLSSDLLSEFFPGL